MRQEKLLSVIVPVYNVEQYLARCIDSILQQSYRNLELILVDDGAKDSSGVICDQYAAKDPRVSVIHKKNGGLSSARNAGLDAATGEFLSFVDSDDWLEPGAYAAMISLMEEKQVSLVCGGRYDVDGRTGEKRVGLCPVNQERIPAEELVGRIFLWDNCDSSACDKVYRRELFEDIRYPEGVVCEDVPVIYQVVLKAKWVLTWNQPFYNYYHRSDSISTAPVSEKTFHFSRHTEKIYTDIQEHYPELQNQARYLRVRSLSHLLLVLELEGKDVCRKFAGEYGRAKVELRKHILFFCTSPYFSMQERVRNLLLVFGLYRVLRPVFHKD